MINYSTNVVPWLVSVSDTKMHKKWQELTWCFAMSRSQSTQEIFMFTRNQATTMSTSEEELITGLIIDDNDSMEDTEKKLLANKQQSFSTPVTYDFQEIASNPEMSIIARTQRKRCQSLQK